MHRAPFTGVRSAAIHENPMPEGAWPVAWCLRSWKTGVWNDFGPPPIRTTAKIMKTIRTKFQMRRILAAILSLGAPWAMAQTVDNSTGTVVPSQSPLPVRLTATLLPIDRGLPMSGEVAFVMAGGAVSVTGRIGRLEPDRRYQAVVQFPLITGTSGPNIAAEPASPPSEAGRPEAAPPQAGKPDGEGRPGGNAPAAPPPAPPSIEAELAMFVTDAKGAANLDTIIQNKDLGPPPTGIQGCTLVIKRAPPLDSSEERVTVASGLIVAFGPVTPIPPGP